MLSCFFTACSQNDDQKEFEQKAFSEAEGYTETDPNNGKIINEDPDDWRISPFYQGLVRIEPAYPNPAGSSDRINLYIHSNGIESVSDLSVIVYYGYSSSGSEMLLDEYSGELRGSMNFNFQGSLVAQHTESPQGTYRVIIVDGNENVVSYGDIQIE